MAHETGALEEKRPIASAHLVEEDSKKPTHLQLPLTPGSVDAAMDLEVFAALPPDIQRELLLASRQVVASAQETDAADEQEDEDVGMQHVELDEGQGGWTCRVCTFVNHPQLIECEICETLCIQVDSSDAEGTGAVGLNAQRSRQQQERSELYAKLSQRLGNSVVSRSLKKIRLPVTPASVVTTNKDEPTAEDLLIAATNRIQQLRSAAAQSLLQAKQTLLASNKPKKRHPDGLEPKLPSSHVAMELAVLQHDLNQKCVAGGDVFERLLERLWNTIYKDAPRSLRNKARSFERVSDGWIAMGFQREDPETDFRGGGLLALKCLVYVFEAYPQRMLEIVAQQTLAGNGTKWYPVCVAGINLTCIIAGVLKLGNGKYEQTPEVFWPLFEEPSAFYQLFFYGKQLSTWRSR